MSDFANGGERVEGAGGLKILFRSWRPKEKARALIVIVPGFNAHSGYYTWVAQQFVDMSLAVYAVDLRAAEIPMASVSMLRISTTTSATLRASQRWRNHIVPSAHSEAGALELERPKIPLMERHNMTGLVRYKYWIAGVVGLVLIGLLIGAIRGLDVHREARVSSRLVCTHGCPKMLLIEGEASLTG